MIFRSIYDWIRLTGERKQELLLYANSICRATTFFGFSLSRQRYILNEPSNDFNCARAREKMEKKVAVNVIAMNQSPGLR